MSLHPDLIKCLNLTGKAFGGSGLDSHEQGRRIWEASVHPYAIWEGPTFEKPVRLVGYEANAAFNEFLLSVAPKYKMEVVRLHETPDLMTAIFELKGFGETVDGGTYTNQYLSMLTVQDGKFKLMREFCNPFETYKAFGKARWEDAIDQISKLNVDEPELARIARPERGAA